MAEEQVLRKSENRRAACIDTFILNDMVYET